MITDTNTSRHGRRAEKGTSAGMSVESAKVPGLKISGRAHALLGSLEKRLSLYNHTHTLAGNGHAGLLHEFLETIRHVVQHDGPVGVVQDAGAARVSRGESARDTGETRCRACGRPRRRPPARDADWAVGWRHWHEARQEAVGLQKVRSCQCGR